jgi:CRP-like cAMP-binding protein
METPRSQASSMLTDTLLKLISGPAEMRQLQPHEFLFRQGDRAQHVFSVEEGYLRLTRCLSNGKSVVMHVARAGSTFTEAALFSDVYHCDAVADVKTRVRMHKKQDILEAIKRDSSLALEYVASLSKEVMRLRTQLELHNIQSARERILQFFLLEAAPDSLEFKIEVSLKDVAANLGLAHETFYRELARLEQEGIVTRHGKTIRIRESHGL